MCSAQLTIGVAPQEHVVGAVVLVSYEESIPIDTFDDESDGSYEPPSAPAIVLSKPVGGNITIAWLLPVGEITLAAGYRRPVRWTGRDHITHVVDCTTLSVDSADAAPHPNPAGIIIDPSTVYTAETATLSTDLTYAAFLAANMIV
jgi:hypothetical protein